MAFITIGDWTVDTAKGGQLAPISIGNTKRAYDGSPLCMRRNMRRRWSFGTIPLAPPDAEGLIGMVSGRGWHWQYDTPWQSDNTTASDDFYSTTGLGPTGSVAATVVPGYDLQTVAKRVYEESSGEPESKFGNGALKVEPSTTNLLPADSRDAESAPSGYNLLASATLSAETTIVLQGTKSLKCITSATAFSGFITGDAAANNNTTYTGSAYVYALAATELRFQLYDNAGTIAFTDYNPTPNVWERLEVTGTTAGSGTTYTRIGIQLKNAGTAATFYSDMFQIEETDYATAWVDGSRASGVLRYDLDPIPRALTVAGWFKAPSSNPTSDSYLWILRCDDATNKSYLQAKRTASTNNISFVISDGTNSKTISYATSPWDDDWHHVAFVYAPNVDGNGYLELYYDGTLQDSNKSFSGTGFPKMITDSVERFYPGNNAGATQWVGAIDELFVFPFPMSANQIAALAGRTTALPKYPRLEITGDLDHHLDENGIEVEGLDKVQSGYAHKVDGVTFKSYMQRVSFELQSAEDIG
jgi:hypothetical protein